jgi:O-antigen/teichoic acid export membrane protein
MATIATTNPAAVTGSSQSVVRDQIRGSGLLILGKVLSVGVTSLAQVLIVRHLTTNDYGSFAYALSVMLLWQGISNFGLHEAIARFLPIYHDRGDHARMFGTILLSLAVILLTGGAVITALFVWPELLLRFVREPSQSLTCLFVLIFLVPLEAIDSLLMGLFASLASAKSIFYRRHVVGPGLKLAAVLAMLALHHGALFLAFGYLAATLIGIVWYSGELIRQLHDRDLLSKFRYRELRLPFREVFSFTVPMMTSDLVSILNQSFVVMVLGYYFGMREVALLRVVIPAAAINSMVAVTAALLYLPAASRMFANGDREGLQTLYCRTAAWIAILSFPIFTATFCFARPLTVMLYGDRYADSGILLAILSIGYYFDTVFGFNGLTLKAANRMGYMVACNLGAAVANVTLSVLLVPRYGALGAAIAIATSLAVLGILKQIAMSVAVGITIDRKSLALYSMLAAALAVLVLVYFISAKNIYAGAALAAVTVSTVFLVSRKELNITDTFPEIRRLPLIARIFA